MPRSPSDAPARASSQVLPRAVGHEGFSASSSWLWTNAQTWLLSLHRGQEKFSRLVLSWLCQTCVLSPRCERGVLWGGVGTPPGPRFQAALELPRTARRQDPHTSLWPQTWSPSCPVLPPRPKRGGGTGHGAQGVGSGYLVLIPGHLRLQACPQTPGRADGEQLVAAGPSSPLDHLDEASWCPLSASAWLSPSDTGP